MLVRISINCLLLSEEPTAICDRAMELLREAEIVRSFHTETTSVYFIRTTVENEQVITITQRLLTEQYGVGIILTAC